MRKSVLTILLISCFTFGCKSEKKSETKIEKTVTFEAFDGDLEAERKAYTALGLDETCPNLLDPRISKEDIDNINKAWLDLNKELGAFLTKNEFSWNTSEPMVKIWHKFYFYKDGSLKAYFFKVQNASISDETRAIYKGLVIEFAKTYQLPLTKDSTFAQCGKGAFAT